MVHNTVVLVSRNFRPTPPRLPPSQAVAPAKTAAAAAQPEMDKNRKS